MTILSQDFVSLFKVIKRQKYMIDDAKLIGHQYVIPAMHRIVHNQNLFHSINP